MRSREATSGRVVLDADMRPKAGQTQRRAARATHGSYGKPGESQGEAKRSEEEPPVLRNLRRGRQALQSAPACICSKSTRPCESWTGNAPMRQLDRNRALAIVGYNKRKEHKCKAVGAIGLSRGGAQLKKQMTVCESALCRLDHFVVDVD